MANPNSNLDARTFNINILGPYRLPAQAGLTVRITILEHNSLRDRHRLREVEF